jgi:hypothetical protein
MRLLVPSLAPALALAACGGGDPPPDADEALACLTSGRGEMFTVGLDHPGRAGMLDFKLMSATPAPPGRDFNTWVIQVNAMSGGAVGAPVSGATLTVAPFMPDHQHGPGAYQPKIQAMPEAGQYKIEQINTWMPGYWEITVEARAGAVEDSAVFKFCIQA